MLHLPSSSPLLSQHAVGPVLSAVAPPERQPHAGQDYVLLTDGRGGTYVLPASGMGVLGQGIAAARVSESNPSALGPSPGPQQKRQKPDEETGSAAKRTRLDTASTASPRDSPSALSRGDSLPDAGTTQQPASTQLALAGDQPGEAPAPPPQTLSDNESANSSRSRLHASASQPTLASSSASGVQQQPQQQYVVVRAPNGNLQLLSTCAIAPAALGPQPLPAGLVGAGFPGGVPLAGALQVPAGMLMPTAAGYELRPAQSIVPQASAAIAYPGHELRQLATEQPSAPMRAPWLDQDRALEAALAEVQDVMLHKPRGRPVKYIDLGVNRMALKYHVGIKISGVIQSVGATDSELAAHILLDLAKIGLGLYSPAAGAATPHASVHADEQMTQQLMAPAYRYSSQLVQRVVAQLINRSLVPASELLHAYSRAHGAGCRPGPCLMSVSAALSSSTAQCVTRVTQ